GIYFQRESNNMDVIAQEQVQEIPVEANATASVVDESASIENRTKFAGKVGYPRIESG
ncbi:hypothetical protein PIB30_058378, partial [Stylosanthes scabra]|nr:hypothetical protein [Stylosanthes scabra]